MKKLLILFSIMISSVFFAKGQQIEELYKQIPAVQDVLICEKAENYKDEIAQIYALSNHLKEIIKKLEEESKIQDESNYQAISGVFPTKEELDSVDKLSEEKQIAYWNSIEMKQTEIETSISINLGKFNDEKESLALELFEYQNEHLQLTEEFSIVHYLAMKEESDKKQDIENRYRNAANNLTEEGKQEIEKIEIEFCAVVSASYLKILKFEYANLKKIMAITRRLAAIEIMESSALSEEEMYIQNAAVLNLSEIELLDQFLTNYITFYSFLPDNDEIEYK